MVLMCECGVLLGCYSQDGKLFKCYECSYDCPQFPSNPPHSHTKKIGKCKDCDPENGIEIAFCTQPGWREGEEMTYTASGNNPRLTF